ncbi:phage portal protein [Bremerella sp. JC770]|uniref:phage portal protein n=1 Tax=Bremerella sp. JC770 TaxID=3232137 RepID=UPI003457F7FC
MTNATTPPTDYVHEASQLRARLETHYLRQELALVENTSEPPPRVVHESFHDPAPVRQGFAELPFGHAGTAIPDIPTDRADGDLRPVFGTEWQLAELRGTARSLATSSYGTGIVDGLTSYIVRTGFDYQTTAIRGQHTPQSLVADVQRIVRAFLDDNQWQLDFEQQLCAAQHVDGETILVLEEDAGHVRVRRAEPAWLTEPADSAYLQRRMNVSSELNWKYGIATDQHDASRVHGYFIQWNADPSAWRLYSPARVVHIKSNTPRHVKRGLTDFYPVVTELADAVALNHRMSKGAAIQASIAMIIEAAQGSGGLGIGDPTHVGASLVRGKTSPGAISSAGRYASERRSDWHEGMVIDTKGKKFQAGPMGGAQSDGFVKVLQAGLRSVGVRWNMPEHLISGDASNNNYASILEAGSPFVCRIEAEQEKLCKAYERMLWSVLRIHFEMGRLNLRRYGLTWNELRQCVNLIVTGTSPAIGQRRDSFEVDAQLYDRGLMSADTLAAKYDLDPEEERQKQANTKAP